MPIQPEEAFNIMNRYLGWGDPNVGLWFIGMEERETFSYEDVASRKGKVFEPVERIRDLDWKVANTTARIVSSLINELNFDKYRDSIMWRKGSHVFNGNLLPLGKPKRKDWPKHYKELFDLGNDDHQSYMKRVKNDRYDLFKEFRRERNPQAIVCFGKEFWSQFEKIFINHQKDKKPYDKYGLVVFSTDKVIFTRTFSYGRWMPKDSVKFIASQLSEWGVKLPNNLPKC